MYRKAQVQTGNKNKTKNNFVSLINSVKGFLTQRKLSHLEVYEW